MNSSPWRRIPSKSSASRFKGAAEVAAADVVMVAVVEVEVELEDEAITGMDSTITSMLTSVVLKGT